MLKYCASATFYCINILLALTSMCQSSPNTHNHTFARHRLALPHVMGMPGIIQKSKGQLMSSAGVPAVKYSCCHLLLVTLILHTILLISEQQVN